MSKRLNAFIESLKSELTDYEIAAAVGNGDVVAPEWISMAESTDHVKIWDNETPESHEMGFVRLDYMTVNCD